ncbi:heparinase II/III domain-containing protein [Flavobacterium fluviatile]|uniref:heparinase II/III domain-containing protein n=1 Tax=Flavobacterium fluviatile TaxID=1862387 RepID=UPI001AD6CA07|nr:heparinase II/III family protein [Flavobacterium fluviatile]
MKKLLPLLAVLLLMIPLFSMGQTASHPRIFTTNADKAQFLETLKTVAWKNSLVESKKAKVEKYIAICEKDPTWLVSRLQMNWKTKHSKIFLKGGKFDHSVGKAPVPTVRFSGTRDWASDYARPKLEDVIPYLDDPRGLFLANKKGVKEWVHPSKVGFTIEKINEQIMDLAADAAFLYWVTGDEKYARFAKPVFETYMEGMYYLEAPVDLENGNQQRISGLTTFEVIHEGILVKLATTYDFLYDFIKKEKVNMPHCEAVFQKWGDQIIVNGIPDNNWNLFQARFLMYVALVLEDNSHYKNGKGREYYLDHTFTTSTERQLSIKESLLVYDQENGMWPECATYSVHVIQSLLDIFTLLDHYTNNNELSQYPIVEKAALASFQYLFPNGYMVGFGDSSHKPLPPENFELLISNYRKYKNEEKETLLSGLLQQMIANGEYKRKADDLFELFFYVDNLKAASSKDGLAELTTPTFYASNVSMFNQRVGVGKAATMVSTVGSYGNHSHANGIAMELYANQYVLGPDAGKGPSYWHTDHNNYYSKFPAHNTVVVDGISDYGAMRGWHPFKLENYFPKVGEIPAFDKLTFANVSFFEPKAKANQQRFTAIIKSNSNQSYILDVFRSKKQNDGKQRHDYFYHNLGQTLEILDNNSKAVNLTNTDDFGSKNGDLKAYDYLKEKKKIETANDVQALFRLKAKGQADHLMKLWIKGSDNQSIYTALAPKSNAISKGTAPSEVLNDPMQTLIIKREDSAWDNPFAIVYNPYIEGEKNPITAVKYSSVKENPSTQLIEVLLDDKKTVDTIVLNTNDEAITAQDHCYQKGLFSISRKEKEATAISYLFVSGMYKFEQNGWGITASGEAVSVSIERSGNSFVIESDGPVLLQVPFLEGKKLAKINVYENDTVVDTREGQINRANPEQLEFRLSKATKKAVIVF